ncbi:hypothetical protein FHL15_005905 [Xylaria flabelliformis]|uniref:Uncharacterized protein n=1 Tax=Xylaria flabelliformis TaxID=2512241 RepID=A0A553HZD9_9PEZI|nr:hypothetical protein FHL15_005905 [Xylaria flabelliformis]
MMMVMMMIKQPSSSYEGPRKAKFRRKERAKAVVAPQSQGLRIYRSPDSEHFEKLVTHASRECAGEGENPDMHWRCGRLELEISGSLSERIEGLIIIFGASIMAGSLYTLNNTILFRIDVERTLREFERVLAPLASPTWIIDLHTEDDVVNNPVDEKENSSDEKIDNSETKGKTVDMPRDTTENEMDEADEVDDDDEKGKQSGDKKKKKKKRRRRRRRRIR